MSRRPPGRRRRSGARSGAGSTGLEPGPEVGALLRDQLGDFEPDGDRMLRMIESRITADDQAADRPVVALMGPAGRRRSRSGPATARFRPGSTPVLVGAVGAVVGVVIVAAVAVGSLRTGHGLQVYAVGDATSGPAATASSSRASTALGAAVSTAKPSVGTPGTAPAGPPAGEPRTSGALGPTVATTSTPAGGPIPLPPTGARDWALLGVTDDPGTAVRAAKPTGHLGALAVTGSRTVLTSGGPRFSWRGGTPTAAGTDDGRRLAVPLVGGRFRLAGTVGAHGDVVVLHAGTVNGSAQVVVHAGSAVTERAIRGGPGSVDATITVRLPTSVAGSAYTIDLVGGPAAGNQAAPSAGRADRSSIRTDRSGAAHHGAAGGAGAPDGSGDAGGSRGGGTGAGGTGAAHYGSGTVPNPSGPPAGLLTLSSAILF